MTTSSSAPTAAAAITPDHQSILDNIALSKVSLLKSDVTFTASFTIENKNAFPVKDVEITCHHYANSGTEIDSNTRTVYEIVPAKGSKRINGFAMGFIHSQAAKSACGTVSAKTA